MLTKTMNPLQELIAVGADAQAGLYDIDINIPGGDIAAQQLRVRNAGFKAPETSQDIYQVKYKGATLTRPKASLNIGQTFEVQFRLDANYQVYKALVALENRTSNPAFGYASSSLPAKDQLATVTVYALTSPITDINQGASSYSSTNSKPMFIYKGCWISKLTKPEFKNGDMSTINITATFQYMDFEDPQSGLLS